MSRRLRKLLDRLRDWWHGPPGRHYRPSYALSGPAAPKWPWAGEPPLPRADLEEAEQLLDDGLRRAMYPRLYAPADTYWGAAYIDLFAWAARMAADRTTYRRSWGLDDESLSTRPEFLSLPAVA